MVCRNFHCNGFTFDENTCKRNVINSYDHCLVLSVKLAFGTRNPLPIQQLSDSQLWLGLKYQFAHPPITQELDKDVKLYIATMAKDGILFIDYLVVQLYLTGSAIRHQTIDLDRFVNNIHGRPCYSGFDNMFPMCELVLYDAKIVPEHALTDPKPELENSVPHYHCKEKNLHVVNKLFFCLHVKLKKNELNMEISTTMFYL